MDELKHVEQWKANKKRQEAEWVIERERRDKKESAINEKLRGILESSKATDCYVSRHMGGFAKDGMVYQFNNQGCRLLCSIRRPFQSEADKECFRDMEGDMMSGRAPSLVHNYQYKHFIIDAKPARALKRFLKY